MAKKNVQPMPAWIKWPIFLFIAYALITGFFHRDELPGRGDEKPDASMEAPQKEAEGKTELPSAKLLDTLRDRQSDILVRTLEPGMGEPVVCGQQVTVTYRGYLSDGTLYTEQEEPVTVRLGSRSLLPGLELGIIGMRPRAQRRIDIPSVFAHDYPDRADEAVPAGSEVYYEVKLLEVAPEMEHPEFGLRTFNSGVPRSLNEARCGSLADIDLRLWSVQGEPLYDARSHGGLIRVRLGMSDLPIGIELATLGMQEGGIRSAIVPPAYLSYMTDLEAEPVESPSAENTMKDEAGDTGIDEMIDQLQPVVPGRRLNDVDWPGDEALIIDIKLVRLIEP